MKNSDQSAFPVDMDIIRESGKGTSPFGLTKREYFAIELMSALVGRWTDSHDSHYVPAQGSRSIKELATHSIELADELLKQLE